jgi:hypothetical protein
VATYRFVFDGQWDAYPQSGGLLASGAISDRAPIREFLTLDAKQEGDYPLNTDSAVPVDFGGVVDANVVIIFSDRPITVSLTPSGGSPQTIPCDDMIAIISRTTPYTAISLTRTPATTTNAVVFIGEQA